MAWFRKKKPAAAGGPTRSEALACRPVRHPLARSEEQAGGRTLVTYPVEVKPFYADLARRFGLWRDGENMTRRMELDELGSMAWGLMDGERSVRDIAGQLAARYGLLPLEAETATAEFVRMLGKKGLVAVRGPRG